MKKIILFFISAVIIFSVGITQHIVLTQYTAPIQPMRFTVVSVEYQSYDGSDFTYILFMNDGYYISGLMVSINGVDAGRVTDLHSAETFIVKFESVPTTLVFSLDSGEVYSVRL